MQFHSNEELIQHLKDTQVVKSDQVEQVMLQTNRTHYKGEYFDSPQPIGHKQTISAPHMHGMCLELLSELIHQQNAKNILDVGSGSGYLTACMARLAGPNAVVTGIETIPELVRDSIANLNRDCPEFLEKGRIVIKHGNGWLGYPPNAPYDAIHVGAAAETLPQALVDQLRPGGKLVIPLGPQEAEQWLYVITKKENGETEQKRYCGVRYVPLVRD